MVEGLKLRVDSEYIDEQWFEDYTNVMYADLKLAFKLFEKSRKDLSYLPLSLYHAQQALEKAIKAYLVEAKLARIKDLINWRHVPFYKTLEKINNIIKSSLKRKVRSNSKDFLGRKFLHFAYKMDKIVNQILPLFSSKRWEQLFREFIKESNETLKEISEQIKEIGDYFNKILKDSEFNTTFAFYVPTLCIYMIRLKQLREEGKRLLRIDKDDIKRRLRKFENWENYKILVKNVIDEYLIELENLIRIHNIRRNVMRKIEEEGVFEDPNSLSSIVFDERFKPLKFIEIFIPLDACIDDVMLGNLIYLFPFATYGRYVEVMENTTTLRLLVNTYEKDRNRVYKLLLATRGYVNLMYSEAYLYHTLRKITIKEQNV